MITILVLDVVDACNLTCVTCPRGTRIMANSRHTMPYAGFCTIINKAKAEGIREIKLYNWGEPFIHPHIDRLVSVAHLAGMKTEISTNLSLTRMDTLLPAFEAGLDRLIVSISGVTQSTHGINHRNSTLETVFSHLESLAQAKRQGRIGADILLRYLHFSYNTAEARQARQMAADWGFSFELLEATGDPLQECATNVSPDISEDGCEPHAPEHAHQLQEPSSCPPGPMPDCSQICALTRHIAVLDAWGMVYLCCARPSMPPFRLGRYLDLSLAEIFRRMHAHPECARCGWLRVPTTRSEHAILQNKSDVSSENSLLDAAHYQVRRVQEFWRREGLGGFVRHLRSRFGGRKK